MGEAMAFPLRDSQPRSGAFKVGASAAERFAACFEQRAGLEWILSPEGNVLETNAAAADLLGAEASAVAGRAFADALWWSCGPDAEPVLRERIALAAKGYPARCELALRRASRDSANYEICFTPIEDEAASVAMILVEARDVTAHKRIADAAANEIALRRRAEDDRDELARASEDEKRWLRTVIAHAPVGIVLLRGARGERVIVNPFARPFLGEPPRCEETIVRFDGTMCAPGGAPCPRRTKLAVRALGGETIVGEEALLRRPDGRDARLLLSASPILDARGTVYGAVLLLKDISKLRASMPPPPLQRW
jgi:PAS domain S-box-containing protein